MKKHIKKALSLVLAFCMTTTLMVTSLGSTVSAADDNTFYRIFHLDAGRKYFSVDQIKTIIDTMAESNYTHMELAIGNDGLRFLLNDMSVTANDTTYTSDAVKAGIQAGNKAYYDAGMNELTEAEMDTIISYSDEKGIEIIPLLNTPGHMDAILDCMESVGISDPAYNNSARTVDVTNNTAVNFTLALVDKYIKYFAGKGCTIFNMGCDEYANDVSNSGFAGLISSGKYGDFITFVNSMAAQVKAVGMTPMAFNDGIYYNSNTSSGTFDEDIMIAYWTSGWSGYSPASASFLAGKGHKIINTNDAWYYVLGRAAGNSSGYTIATAQKGVQNTACTDIPGDNDPIASGCMICLWCDTPSVSYSDTEASNVTGLISTFATSNSTYFVASEETDPEPIPDPDPDDPVEVTENETITVTVGQTEEATISKYNFAGTYTTEDSSIATVEVTGEDGSEVRVTYTQVTRNPKWNTLIESNTTSPTSYYYLASDGTYYQLYVTRSSGRHSTYNYNLGYYRNGSNKLSSVASATNSKGDSAVENVTLYEKSVTDAVPAYTTVLFTGVSVGTTYVTVGNTRYTINVVAEDLSKVTPLTVEYWITNLPVTADGATSKEIAAKSVYGEDGGDVSSLIPETGTYAYGSVVYWKGTVLDSTNKQTTDAGIDKTGSGKDFSLIRYYNGSWQYYYEADGTWNTISSTDQVVIYWLQPTEVTKEITTLVKDWGFSPSNQGDRENKVALTVAVVYPDGTVSPAEGDMYSTSTTLFNYWSNRDIGLVAPVNNSNYVISKITVTDGTRDQSGTGQWGANDTITWEKVSNEAGEEWYNETTYWDETDGGTPMVNGATSNITWPKYNTAKLVLIYLKPIHYDTNLIVNWVDDNASGALISTMEVAVSSDGTPTTFYNGLKQTSVLPSEGVGGTFTLDDDAYIVNSSNVKQAFNKKISTIPGVADQYKSGLYQYISADLSADGKTLTLHYNIDETKLNKNYVVDFGLPVRVPLSSLVESVTIDSIQVVTATTNYGTAVIESVDGEYCLVYTPNKVLAGIDTVTVKVFDEIIRIGFIPATTVYYEEGFAESKTWNGGSKGTGTQTLPFVGSEEHYGYDKKYAVEKNGASNGTQISSVNIGDDAVFTFNGTGIDIYANCTPSTGSVNVMIRDSKDSLVKLLKVNTATGSGKTDATEGQDVVSYSLPIVSLNGLVRDTYTVTIRHCKTEAEEEKSGAVNLDGFKVFGTLDESTSAYVEDEENNPNYTEVRNSVLKALDVSGEPSETYAGELADQVYNELEGENGAIVISNNVTGGDNAQDLLENGPKNEIFLRPNESLVFNLGDGITSAQIGLKAVNNNVTYSINNENTTIMSTSTDMFYKLNAVNGGVTITNVSGGILSVTDLKWFGDLTSFTAIEAPTPLTLRRALVSLGYEDEEEPVEPEEPEVPAEADANLNISVVDYSGKELASSILTVTGSEGEEHAFTAAEVIEAAKSVLPKGYALADESSIANQTVIYGEDGSVNVLAGKVATLQVIYKKKNKVAGTATLTHVQTTSSSKYTFTSKEIQDAAPSGCRVNSSNGKSVKYGSTKKINVSCK